MSSQNSYNSGVTIVTSDTPGVGDFEHFQQNKRPTDAIQIGGAGVIPVVFPDGTVVNFTVVAGQVLPVAARRVNAQNCTATLMVALYQV